LTAQQLLARYGIVMRETAVADNVPGGYAAIYPALKIMEESGSIRRGMFVAAMGAAQFATPKAVDMLRSLRIEPERPETVHVILVGGRLAAFFRRRNPALQVFIPDDDPERTRVARELAQKLAMVAIRHQTKRGGLLISTINSVPATDHFLARFLEDSGFVRTAVGFQMRRVQQVASSFPEPADLEMDEEDA
jgi:ATP-dependent Lhr-like helicase